MRILGSDVEESEYDVIDLEFAFNSERMDKILDTWGNELIEKELFVTYIDFLFLIAYGTLLASICLILSRSTNNVNAKNIGMWFVFISYSASIFDLMENVFLIIILSNPSNYPRFAPFIASVFASIKFFLIFIVLLYIIVVGLLYIKNQFIFP